MLDIVSSPPVKESLALLLKNAVESKLSNNCEFAAVPEVLNLPSSAVCNPSTFEIT